MSTITTDLIAEVVPTAPESGPAMFANMNARIDIYGRDAAACETGWHLFEFDADPDASDACAVCLGGISIEPEFRTEMESATKCGYYVKAFCRHCHDAVTAKATSIEVSDAVMSNLETRNQIDGIIDSLDTMVLPTNPDISRQISRSRTIARLLSETLATLVISLNDEARQGVS